MSMLFTTKKQKEGILEFFQTESKENIKKKLSNVCGKLISSEGSVNWGNVCKIESTILETGSHNIRYDQAATELYSDTLKTLISNGVFREYPPGYMLFLYKNGAKPILEGDSEEEALKKGHGYVSQNILWIPPIYFSDMNYVNGYIAARFGANLEKMHEENAIKIAKVAKVESMHIFE